MTQIEQEHEFGSSFDIPLDDEVPSRGPVYVDVVSKDHEIRPIIPASLRGMKNIQSTVKYHLRLAECIAAFHAVRSPMYATLTAFWASVGLFRLIGRQLSWWWLMEQYALRQAAATNNDADAWVKLHNESKKSRAWRGVVLLAEVIAVFIVARILAGQPWWYTAVTLAAVMPGLAKIGRPVDRPILQAAVVSNRLRRINADIVLRAYYAARLGDPVKPDQQVTFGSTMSRDTQDVGSQVLVDLPYGKGFDDAMKSRGALASGLDVSLSQVFLTRDKSSHRRHLLWVADADPFATPAGRTPLLALKQTDVWQPAPFGRDERNRLVQVFLLWNSFLIGAQPRKGKTFAARLLALYVALDPYARISVFDGKGSPDWRDFRHVAHRYAFGLLPTPQGDPVQILVQTLRELKKEVLERNNRLSALPVEVCPEGKLTRAISRDPKYNLPVYFLVLDEFQEFYNTGDTDADKEIADLLEFLIKVGPSVGVILIDSTQKPSGVGSSQQVEKKFTNFRDQHTVRFALKTGSWQVSDLILGSGAYSEGLDSSTLPLGDEYRGIGILHGLMDDSPTVRTFLADGQNAKAIIQTARGLRERAGTLSGMALGESGAVEVRDFLQDVRDVFYAGEARISYPELTSRLRDKMPEHYADITADAISSQLRALGVKGKSVKDKNHFASGTGQGFDLSALEAAISARSIAAR